MQASRRIFIRNHGGIGCRCIINAQKFIRFLIEPENWNDLGLQLYTVRDAMKADPAGTLKKLADARLQGILNTLGYVDRKVLWLFGN